MTTTTTDTTHYGPTQPLSMEIMESKYLQKGESFRQGMTRIAQGLSMGSTELFNRTRPILYKQEFLPAGRIQSSAGATRQTTAFNCFVMDTLPDSMEGIMRVLGEAAQTMRLGGGVGYDFSTLRPRGDLIRSLDSKSSGPLSFMEIFNALCGTIMSAGHRRGAQMGCLRVDHPDIEEFISAKTNFTRLTNFNISVLVTDEFIKAVKEDKPFDLTFEGKTYRTVNARALWDKILRNTWDWAEPGVLFIDRINKKNNLWYCETIAATNPCGEQPLPPHGACLLGSHNLAKLVTYDGNGKYSLDYLRLQYNIPYVVEMMDNVIDTTVYPLREQEVEAKAKRRMGLGVTGVANALEVCGYPYGSDEFLERLDYTMRFIRDETYKASIELAKRKGSFPLFNKKTFGNNFFANLPDYIQEAVVDHGIRNSHLLSVAPTGTISLAADNVSSGIEPVFSHEYTRKVMTFDGTQEETVKDYAWMTWGFKGRTANEVSVKDHVNVLNVASRYVDSACSKTCNVGPDVTWEEFKQVYMDAYDGGASGCTTFRLNGKRAGILVASSSEDVAEPTEDTLENKPEDILEVEGAACYIDPMTGIRSCDG